MPEAIRQGDVPGVQLRRRREVALPLEELWPWLVEPERLARWLADEIAVDGAALRLASPGRRAERAEMLEQEPPRLLRFTFERDGWGASTRLTLRLHRVLAGAEVDLFHEGFHRLPPALSLPLWEEHRKRWESALDRLAAAAEA
jgi:uncharacterized protein YndB with AHSA1/START domain